MLLLIENPEDTLRLLLIKNRFQPSCTNVRFVPVTATYIVHFVTPNSMSMDCLQFPNVANPKKFTAAPFGTTLHKLIIIILIHILDSSISFVLIGFVKVPKNKHFLMITIMEGLYNASSHCDVYIGGSRAFCDSGKDC